MFRLFACILERKSKMTDRAITSGLIEHPDQLKEHIAELEQQLAECQVWSDAGYRALETQTKALFGCQAREEKLREASRNRLKAQGITVYSGEPIPDDSALKEACEFHYNLGKIKPVLVLIWKLKKSASKPRKRRYWKRPNGVRLMRIF